MSPKAKQRSTFSHEQVAVAICVFTAVITLQDNAAFQYGFGFIVGFVESLSRSF